MYKINSEPEYEKVRMSKSADGWTEYFNQPEFIKKKIKQISLVDFYAAIKENSPVLPCIKQDLIDGYLVCSDRINYKSGLLTKVIHDADSKLVQPKNQEANFPVYSLDIIREDKDIEKAFQALFGTIDKISDIIGNLKKFGDVKEIRFWTPSESDRKAYPIRAVGLCFSRGGSTLYVDCDGRVDVSYSMFYSRGVKIDSAPKEPSKVEA